MKNTITFAAAAASFVAASAAFAQHVVMDWVTVGNPGNAYHDDSFRNSGRVDYEYRIGTYEVTNSQYAAFLNAVAVNGDPNNLYNPLMGSDPRGGITRVGSANLQTYSVRPNMGNKPVNFVSWFDAARMANWMTNGQGLNGGSGDTESGVYPFLAETSVGYIPNHSELTDPDVVFLPTTDEWHKAAYHQPATQGGDSDNYWLYATQSNSQPRPAFATATGDVSNPGQDVVNHSRAADWNGVEDGDGNVTTVGSAGSTTFYGAFDMNGNVREWVESFVSSSSRGTLGGSFSQESYEWDSRTLGGSPADKENDITGFRLASPVPAPACRADVNGDGMLDLFDILGFFDTFGDADPAADINGDGTLDLFDILGFFDIFGEGC